ncbi:MAG TPA: condensation domain-containing protein, partial [Thermoanaerobaculia bacterium]|nr:condensation domain-containing protein [Thermoanaerobaculia bacterium]
MLTLPDRFDRLSPRQRALLEQRLQERQGPRLRNRILPRPAALTGIPLSFAQQRLWFLDQLAPGGSAYNMPVALRVEGPLAPEVLALCLGEIVRRHETLRTVFTEVEGSPVQ